MRSAQLENGSPRASEDQGAALDDDDARRSSFRLEISVAVGYSRKRTVLGAKWEGPIISVGLLLGGIAVTTLVVLRVFQINL